MTKYFYCQSYQAFNLALSMNSNVDIIIISSAKNILLACKYLNVKHMQHQRFTLSEMIKNKRNVVEEKSKLISIIGDDELHFSHTQFAVFCFYLVKGINDMRGKTVFHNFEFVYNYPTYSSIKKRKYLKTKVYNFLLKHIYKMPVEVRMSSSTSFMHSLKISYIKNSCYKIINDRDKYYDNTLNLFKTFSIDYSDIDFLFIAQSFLDNSFFNQDKIKELIPILNNSKISLKNHPKLESIKELEECNVLPEFISVEFFFNRVKKAVVSIHSASLITASKLDSFKTISLLDIVKSDDPFMAEVKQDMIRKSNNRILFPQNIAEFKTLLLW